MIKSIQLNGFVDITDLKPEISAKGIYFPVSIEHVDLDKYFGDARSFGYNFDDGLCSVVKYELVMGALADDTIEIFNDCADIKKSLKKPTYHILDIVENGEPCNIKSAHLLIRYGEEFFYEDKKGFFFFSKYFCHGEKFRVTNGSAEIYREVNKIYQQGVVKHNEAMKKAKENLKVLRLSIKGN